MGAVTNQVTKFLDYGALGVALLLILVLVIYIIAPYLKREKPMLGVFSEELEANRIAFMEELKANRVERQEVRDSFLKTIEVHMDGTVLALSELNTTVNRIPCIEGDRCMLKQLVNEVIQKKSDSTAGDSQK